MKRAAVIWDMDGVLVDSGEFHYEAWKWLAEHKGRGLTREQFLPTFGMANPDAIAHIFGETPPTETSEMSLLKEAEFRRRLQGRVKALPGADALVRALYAAGHPQAVASSAPHENIRVILAELGLEGCLQALVSGDHVTRGKPNPQVFRLAAERLGVPSIECVVIEDALVGVQAAIRAGMKVYAVTTTRTREELHHADRVVDSLEELRLDDFLLA